MSPVRKRRGSPARDRLATVSSLKRPFRPMRSYVGLHVDSLGVGPDLAVGSAHASCFHVQPCLRFGHADSVRTLATGRSTLGESDSCCKRAER
jgi:hypothetical protein